MTEAQSRAKKKYREKGKRMTIDFYPTETELYEHVAKQEQPYKYIKDLIREDIKRGKE